MIRSDNCLTCLTTRNASNNVFTIVCVFKLGKPNGQRARRHFLAYINLEKIHAHSNLHLLVLSNPFRCGDTFLHTAVVPLPIILLSYSRWIIPAVQWSRELIFPLRRLLDRHGSVRRLVASSSKCLYVSYRKALHRLWLGFSQRDSGARSRLCREGRSPLLLGIYRVHPRWSLGSREFVLRLIGRMCWLGWRLYHRRCNSFLNLQRYRTDTFSAHHNFKTRPIWSDTGSVDCGQGG